ncbi:MAG: citramalate synthase, partial [Nanoarchaeota archaeon]
MIKLFDTTLRDGTQSSDVNLSVRDKIKVVEALDNFGVDYIELGWPGSNPKDMEAFLEAAKLKLKKSKIVAFGSTRRMNISADDDPNLLAILKSKARVACIFGK